MSSENGAKARGTTGEAPERELEVAAATLVAKYGGDALSSLRRASDLLEFIAALGILNKSGWAREADGWRRAVAQVVAQIEDTDLSATSESRDPLAPAVRPKLLTTEDTLKRAIREHVTLLLHTQKKDGSRRDVEVEPYGLRRMRGELMLVCYNLDHEHFERLPLHRILYSKGEGIHFAPRSETYIEGEDDMDERVDEHGLH